MSGVDSTIPVGFRQVPGFPRYCIDENGIVLSVCRDGLAADRPWSEARRLTAVVRNCGYPYVSLCRDGRVHNVNIHVLVLKTFVGPPPVGMECRHLDGIRTNNHISNLAWGTRRENHRDMILHGTSLKGEKNSKAKLTEGDVENIRRRAENGEVLRILAKEFHVNKSTIERIVKRHTWTHI